MKIFLKELHVGCKKGKEIIKFSHFTYFYGQMGAGKSTIARLVDYCLGGSLALTPALQNEFVYASLRLTVDKTDLFLRRAMDENNVLASFADPEGAIEVSIPAKKPADVILPGTQVEVLSDLVFHLAGKNPPRVRRSKIKEDSDLERLSIRDLLWYCYLDQDTIDSDFFHLTLEANHFKRLKSKDVLRFIVGFHQEEVAELETELEIVRTERTSCEDAVKAVGNALTAADIASASELSAQRCTLDADLLKITEEIKTARDDQQSLRPHGVDVLQKQGRKLFLEAALLNQAKEDLNEETAKHISHKNELLSLAARKIRAESAKEILAGVKFLTCPSCNNRLPERTAEECPVCGQVHKGGYSSELDATADQDLRSRISELDGLISQQKEKSNVLTRQISDLESRKRQLDAELSKMTAEYDSAYLASVLKLERQHASVIQQLDDLKKLEKLVEKIADLSKRAEELFVIESGVRAKLKAARAKAEKDTSNLKRLKGLFLDCLIRSKIHGFLPEDIVTIKAPHFLPEVMAKESADLAVTSFSNLGSGGKKTLFKLSLIHI